MYIYMKYKNLFYTKQLNQCIHVSLKNKSDGLVNKTKAGIIH